MTVNRYAVETNAGPRYSVTVAAPYAPSEVQTIGAPFPSVAAFMVFDHDAYADGSVVQAGRHMYQKVEGATTLADKPDWVPLEPYCLSQWGVVGDGTTQSAKVQAAVTFCAGKYLAMDVRAACLATVVTIAKPMRFEAPTWGDDTVSASQPTNPAFGFVALTADMTMIRVISATASNRLYNVHLKGFALEGQNLAAKGVHFSSVSDSSCDLWTERFRDKAQQWDDGNAGELSSGNRIRVNYQCGSDAAARKGMALHCDRDPTVGSQGCTQFDFEYIQASTPQVIISSVADSAGTAVFTTSAAHQFQVGDVVCIYDSAVYKVRDATVASTPTTTTFTTGAAYVSTDTGRVTASYGCYFAEIDSSRIGFIQSTVMMFEGLRGSGARAARKITVEHVAGHVMADDEANVTILNINSEPSSVTFYGTTCAVQYQVTDRVNGGVYETRKYKMSDSRFLPISAAALVATGTGTLGGASIPVVTFPDSGTPTATWFFAAPPEWDNGTINAVLHYSGGTSGNMYLTTNIATPVTGGGGIGSWDATVTQAVAAAGTPGDSLATLALAHTYARGDGVFLQISRDAANGSDTSTAAFTIMGVEVVYVSSGPNGAGANRFDIPAMRF